MNCPTKGVHQNVQEIINCRECAELIDYLSAKTLGSKGGEKRKENSTLEQRRAWGKLGGRPRKITK